MRRFFGVGLILVLGWMIVPAAVYAWGSATHAYLAKQTANDPDLSTIHGRIYGAVVPDLFNLMFGSPDYSYLYHQTHYNYAKMRRLSRGTDLLPFASGYVSHCEKWAADFTAHRNGRTTRDGYIVVKAGFLAPKMKPQIETILQRAGMTDLLWLAGFISAQLAHPFIETAIDLLVSQNEDPDIAVELAQSAEERPSSMPDLLVAAYGSAFAAHLKIPREEADGLIREAEAGFQDTMVRYGGILAMRRSGAMQALAEQGATLVEGFFKSFLKKEIEAPPEILLECLELATQEIEADYSEELSDTLEYLRKNPRRRLISSSEVPASFWPLANRG
jgi:hypothetical protein